jgi:probable rRNA maturation factor
MNYQIDIESNSQSTHIPPQEQLTSWITQALQYIKRVDGEISVYVVDEEEGQSLNAQYRGKDYPTNVLSFPADIPEEVGVPLLGDLVVCAPVVEREAKEQGKSLDAHWAHMLVHGTLHLLGYDHIDDQDADDMERIETEIMTGMGFPAPYLVNLEE